MDSNERAQLRSFANGIKACYYIGKDGVTDAVIATLEHYAETGEFRIAERSASIL